MPHPICVCLIGAMALIGCSNAAAPPTKSTEQPMPTASAPAAQDLPTGEIRQVFEDYRKALLATDAKAAADLVDTPTLRWYQESVDDARTLKRTDLEKRDMLRRFTVLRLRLEFSRKQLDAMTGQDAFEMAVERGWISRSSVEQAQLAKIEFTSNVMAWASIQQAPNQPLFFFVREANRWKFSLWKTFHIAESFFKSEVEKSGGSEQDYLMQILKVVSANEVTDAILDGPLD